MKPALLHLILIFSFVLHSAERFKWKEVPFFDEIKGYRIIHADDSNTIWIYDTKFNLYKITNGKQQKFDSPFHESLNPIKMAKLEDDIYIAWAFDEKYYSHIRIFKRDHWTKLRYSTELPLIDILKNDKDDYYIHGNFGTLIRLKNDVFSKIKNPFKNHIWSSLKTSEGIWFGGKYDGIFLYKNGRFIKYDFADESNYEIRLLFEKNSEIYAYHDSHNIFKLKDSLFNKINKQLDEISGKNSRGQVGISSYTFEKERHKVELNYPSKLQPTQIFFTNDTLVYLINNKQLLKGTRHQNFYFYELAGSYLIDGAEQSSSRQAFFNDFNNDGETDLLVVNTYPPELNSLYIGNNLYPFQERLFKLDKKLSNLASRVYEFADLNKDYYDDIIVSISDSIGSGISIYMNNKDLTFTNHLTLYSPKYLAKSPVKNIQAVDFDNDGDLDINLSFYYGNEDQPGNDIFFMNSFNGQSFDCDTSYNELTRGWNNKSTFADFDNDGDLDWYISMLWWKDRLFLNENGKYVNKSSTHLDDSLYLNTYGTSFVDIDNDGDLDLLKTCDEQMVAIALNNGAGYFKDATDSLINRYFPLKVFTYQGVKSLNTFDINNDGFTDILLTNHFNDNSVTLLLINNAGKGFSVFNDLGVDEKESFWGSAAADIDYDGDLDIYLFRDGKNLLLANNLDDDNYLRIKLVGVSSTTSAQNSKIWIYRKGGLGNKDSLVLYRETGIDHFSSINKNESIIHFGLDSKNEYSVKVQFQSGKIITLNDIKPPRTITVFEESGFYKETVLLGNTIFNLAMNRHIQFYGIVILLTIVIIGVSIRFGHEKFNWDIRLSLALVIVNFSFFWILLLLSYDSNSHFLKFAVPSIVASIGVIIPNLIFFSIKSNILNKNLTEYKDELLNQAINFSHGEWALKNINSLIFLLQSIPMDIHTNEKFKLQLNNRVTTYNSLTSMSIEKIISLSKQIDFENSNTKLLIQTVDEIKSLNKKILSSNFAFGDKEKNLFKILKEIITLIRNNIISEYSCNPIVVIDQLLETNKSLIKENNVEVEFIYPSEINKKALIKANELADIIDNSITNAIRSFTNNTERTIIIEVKWLAPKFRIIILNNGIEIPAENRDKIFDKGFSTHGSSGIGLFNSRNILRKYGGRILLQKLDTNWTSFLIELNEGFLNETSYSNN